MPVNTGTRWRAAACPIPTRRDGGAPQRGSILLVFNNSPSSRESLSLALSRDGGRRWAVFHRFEEGVRDDLGHLANFSYPYAIQASDGMVHVLYVWHLTRVKPVSFNEAWIRERTR